MKDADMLKDEVVRLLRRNKVAAEEIELLAREIGAAVRMMDRKEKERKEIASNVPFVLDLTRKTIN